MSSISAGREAGRRPGGEGDVVDVRETEKGYFVTMEFDE